ncbi:hypothetical protein BDL97_02G004000 [Sphagnum fallax]|nr:hypothetical protein BDL97_02G004000 [Sphagnum fallax]
MLPGWHASAFLCLLGVDSSMEGHVTSYSSQKVDGQSLDPKVGDGSIDHHDVHDDTLVLEFLRTSMVSNMVNAKERDRVLQQAKRYRLEGTHILRVWEDVRHNKYVLVMVEHFSKWIELVPSPNKSSEGVAYAFLDRVLNHFGAPVKALTDQGTEFQGEFQVLCDKALIDHRTTFRDHPEADGLAERVASLASFSPYFLLYGRNPNLPTTIRRESSEVVNLDDPEMWLKVCSQRAELFRRVMPAAFENLAIAQHRDTLRYAIIRGGGRTILRVREVLAFGVLMLEGRDGVVWKDHVRNCEPCHLPNVDGTVDPSLAVVRVGLRCMLCGSKGGVAHMLVCDRCSRGWHMACMTPPMDVVPVGRWVCPCCILEG